MENNSLVIQKEREDKLSFIESQQKELQEIEDRLLQQLITESEYSVGDIVYWGNEKIWIVEFFLNSNGELEAKTNKVKKDGTKGQSIFNKSFGLLVSRFKKEAPKK